MNKDRRSRLLDAASQLDEVIDSIREVQDEEQDAFDNMPEGLQASSRGDKMLNAIEAMGGFIFKIESVQSDIEKFAN